MQLNRFLGQQSWDSFSPNFVVPELASATSGYVFYFIGIKYRSIMIESSSLKKIGMRAQLTELTEETLFLRILGPSGLAQGHHGPNSYIFLISGVRPILLDRKTITFHFFLW